MTVAGFWSGKRVLITGHTGFKGSWLAIWLEKLGAKVSGFALPPDTSPSMFELSGLSGRMDSRTGDVRELESVREAFSAIEPEVVFHMAAQSLVRRSYRDPLGTYSTNVMGTAHVLEAARSCAGLRAVVVVTSDKCYENREWAWGYRENDPMGGHDPYSSSKGCAELVTGAYRRSYFAGGKTGIASVRAGNVIGGGDWAEDRLIPDCMRSLMAGQPAVIRNPSAVRPWQHVLEPLHGYMLLAERLWERPDLYSEGWNFGPDASDARPVSWIADRIVALWGPDASWTGQSGARAEPPGDPEPHEARYLGLDCSLARSRLAWRPRLDLERALEWVTEWYRQYRQGDDVLPLTLRQIERFESPGAR